MTGINIICALLALLNAGGAGIEAQRLATHDPAGDVVGLVISTLLALGMMALALFLRRVK